MRQVQVYIEGHKLELFEDEQIQINSSVQNINDISKVFTDFSQSFTVPASTVNNAIFEHFYQSDVDSTIDHNIRRSALIEIDLTTFRRGKIQIEKANIKNGLAENYQITFYGEIRTLKDAFGEDKLTKLDLSNVQFTYTAANIYDRITDLATDYDVRFPLIANNRLWTYKAGGEDVTTTAKAIRYDELFPATKVSKIFEAIEAQYGLTFQGTFLSDPRFTNVFLYSKNAIVNEFVTAPTNLDFLSKTNYNDANWSNLSTQNAEDFVDLATNTVNVQNFNPNVFEHIIQIEVLSLSSANTIYIDVFQDGNYYQTFTTSIPNVFNVVIQNTAGLNTNITYQLRSVVAMNVDLVVYYQVFAFYSLNNITNSLCVIQTGTTTITSFINLANYMPDMKVSDFFAGVLKEFNMTCVGLEKDVFEILPLDEWYQQGAIVDITEYTDIDSIDIERIKLFKKIGFKYQQSESFVNRKYNQFTNNEYGNTEYQFAYDGDEYNIEVPFENLLFTRAEETNTPTNYAIFGYCLNENYQGYVPKPILLYLYGSSGTLTHNISFYNGAGHSNISSFAQFGQDLTYQNTKYSLNFGAEISVIHAETIQRTLYAEYYFAYLLNLYNLKNRLTYVKTNLPISLLTNLRLNDRLIIRDKRYIINEMKSNLTTGEVNFSLYLDFRPIKRSRRPIVINEDSQTVGVAVNLVNKAYKADITTTAAGVTISPSTITQSQFVDVTVGANADSVQYILAENGDFLITEDFNNLITENSMVKVITLDVQNTLTDGSTVDQIIEILQE